MPKVCVVFGTRPDAIKMAPVVKQLQGSDRWETQIIVTGQHREMLDEILELFAIKPDADLAVMRQGQKLDELTTRIMGAIGPLFDAAPPDLVLVHGDTTTALATALAAFYRRIKIGHVEAGLRSGTYDNPFPEEANRRLTGMMTLFHFAPTEVSRDNLIREGVAQERVFVTGNTVIDALVSVVEPGYEFQTKALRAVPFTRPVIVVTAHRRENWGAPLDRICTGLAQVSQTLDVEIIFAMHRNPRIQHVVKEKLGKLPRVHLIEAPAYKEFANLLQRCTLLVTDSGGLQEEAPALGKPVLVLRETTERPEGISAGTVKLIGTQIESIVGEITTLVSDQAQYQKMAKAINPYGDGRAAIRIHRVLEENLTQWGEGNGN